MKSCGVTAGECMTALLNLEMQGLILQPMNQYYVEEVIVLEVCYGKKSGYCRVTGKS